MLASLLTLISSSCYLSGFRQKEMLFQFSDGVCNSLLFFSETAGGADTTLGQSQHAYSLFSDAPRLGGYTRYWPATPLPNNRTVFPDIGSPVVYELLLSENHDSGSFQWKKNSREDFSSHSWLFVAAVSKSMPQFHQMMGERLRRVEQGADTVVWLALSKAAARTHSGQFFQGQWVPLYYSFHPPMTGVSEPSSSKTSQSSQVIPPR